ncbi:MAG: glucose-1-phosphate adenylyltransferase [Betaproteobacteria bacterium]|nr:glucose-1-phosphate adenylyltransferase [Betaproteobacteria bacterium]
MLKLKILAFVLAGGEGTRLSPLTQERSKPSVPFGSRYRIVDFVLSNLINSRIYAIYLLVQYKSQSLIEHIRQSWVLSPIVQDQFVTVVPPQMREGPEWFQGTADAVYQNLNLIRRHDPDIVAVFGADHVYRMDVRQMIRFHQEMAADITVATVPVPLAQASSFGIIGISPNGRIREFQEKPEHATAMGGAPGYALASMGNYLFNARVLEETSREAHGRGDNDFGRDVLARLLATHRLFAYDFSTNSVPGMSPDEEPAYWRDVGTIDSYFAANQDTLGARPRFDVFNPKWPIYSSNYQGPTAKIISGDIQNTVFGGGTVIDGARIRNSVIRREVAIEPGCQVDDCIIMDYVRIARNCRLRKVIVDRYNSFPTGTQIGFDPAHDRARFHVTRSGIVVVPRGTRERDWAENHM